MLHAARASSRSRCSRSISCSAKKRRDLALVAAFFAFASSARSSSASRTRILTVASGYCSTVPTMTDCLPAVELASVEKTYALTPGKNAAEGFSILHAALRKTGRVAVGVIQVEKAPRQVAVEATAHGLRMHHLRYADSYRPEVTSLVDTDEAMVGLAVQLIESLSVDVLEPISDAYATRLRAAIAEADHVVKAGEHRDAPADLMAELKASVR